MNVVFTNPLYFVALLACLIQLYSLARFLARSEIVRTPSRADYWGTAVLPARPYQRFVAPEFYFVGRLFLVKCTERYGPFNGWVLLYFTEQALVSDFADALTK